MIPSYLPVDLLNFRHLRAPSILPHQFHSVPPAPPTSSTPVIMAKRFINEPSATVADLMQGLSLDSSRVTLLDPEAGHHVAIRTSIAANTQTPRVAVVSGGGSGHEPMAAGYVADGMLAAAVAGDVYASPSVPAISSMLETIAPRSTGILVVVMNYQGDRLNFRKAVEHLRSKKPGYPVHMMLVDDDVALPNAEAKRGIAGSVFVLKVAGAAADQGRPLAEVVNIAETAARSIASFGVALEPCTLPGHHVDPDRLSPMESTLSFLFFFRILQYLSPCPLILFNRTYTLRTKKRQTQKQEEQRKKACISQNLTYVCVCRCHLFCSRAWYGHPRRAGCGNAQLSRGG